MLRFKPRFNPMRANIKPGRSTVVVDGVMIVGAGPSAVALAAQIQKELGVHVQLIERFNCVGSLWKQGTYEDLKLLLTKTESKLPYLDFADDVPKHPTRQHMIDYLDKYADMFNIQPFFNVVAESVHYYQHSIMPWKVVTVNKETGSQTDYWSRMLVLATGVNADPNVADYPGLDTFPGDKRHSRDYFSGESYKGKKVLVVGSGPSGSDIAMNLCYHGAKTYMVVENMSSSVYVATSHSGDKHVINLVPRIKKFDSSDVELANGDTLHNIDAVVFAIGYHSNYEHLLKGTDYFPENQSKWKGKHGLYVAGITEEGLAGSAEHAVLIRQDMREVLEMSEYDDYDCLG